MDGAVPTTKKRELQMTRPRFPALAAIVMAMLMGACAPVGQNAPDVIEESVSQAHGATATATLTIDLLEARRLTDAAAETAIGDALVSAHDAERSLAALAVTSEQDDARRQAALSAVQQATRAIVAASPAVSEVRGEAPATVVGRLRIADDALSTVGGGDR
ncbi:hypothetical protein FB461_0100 [Rarobacter faecitabidus]|uniref:Uncharacterized protein n=1 Tax=Rarobacter faecitabidus TaxID=13243 RepID=A0A542ZTF3_RARFA|nr:hypothetical protein FB461_0100 [Rarobacter faecitabidus]